MVEKTDSFLSRDQSSGLGSHLDLNNDEEGTECLTPTNKVCLFKKIIKDILKPL